MTKVPELCSHFYAEADNYNNPVDIMIHLFDPLVKPILLYGSEIWAHEGTEILDKLHLRFCKYILLVNRTTCSNMVYGELGEYPLIISAQTRMIMFRAKYLPRL